MWQMGRCLLRTTRCGPQACSVPSRSHIAPTRKLLPMTDTLTAAPAHAADVGAELMSDSADIAAAVADLMRHLHGIKTRLSIGPEADHSPLFLLIKLVRRGPCRASALAELVGADPSTVSRQVASLVKAGLVRRQADPDDGRACLLVPTELGIDIYRDDVIATLIAHPKKDH